VSIAWETTAAGQFHMLWKERGGPVVRMPERTGFGRRVIERMAAISTHGKVDLKFDRAGLEWRIEAHTASVVEG
jgi:two-component sensor histidine kinase